MLRGSGPPPSISLHRVSMRVLSNEAIVESSADAYLLSLPLSRGSVKIGCGGRTIYDGDVRPGMLRVTAPGERWRVERRSAAEAVVLSVPGSIFRRLSTARDDRGTASPLAAVPPIVRPNPQVERLTSALLGLAEIDPAQQPLFLEGVTLALLALTFSPRPDLDPAVRQAGLSDAEFARCIDFAETHLDGGLELSAWAASLGMSLGEFSRRFRETAHAAPYSWFLARRIDRAKQLLADPDRSLVEIALQVGFSSQSHFTDAFRRRTGMSPGHWRGRAPSESR